MRVLIDFNKIAAPLVCFLTISWYSQWNNMTAVIYAALHGTYGILWALKSIYFPSASSSWQSDLGFRDSFNLELVMALFYSPIVIICRYHVQAPIWLVLFCLVIYILGVFFHFVSEMHKYLVLQMRKELVTTGLWGLSRNINYFGELLIFLSLGSLSMNAFPLMFLNCIVTFLWWPNMVRKEKFLSRYPEFPQWKSRTPAFIPYVY